MGASSSAGTQNRHFDRKSGFSILGKSGCQALEEGGTSSHPCILPHLHAEVRLPTLQTARRGASPSWQTGRPARRSFKIETPAAQFPHYYRPSSVYLHHSSSLAHDTTDDTMAPKTPPPGSPPAAERASKTPEQAGSSPTAQRASRSPEQRSPGAAAPGDLLPGDHWTEAPPVWHGSGVAQSY